MTDILCSQAPRAGIWNVGTAAVEFAITAPLLVLLALGAADYGALTAQSSSLAAYARAGTEYARSQVASGNGLPSASTIKSVLNIPSGVAVSFSDTFGTIHIVPALTVRLPNGLPTCPSQSSVNPCLGNADARVLEYVSVTMTQNVTPMRFLRSPTFFDFVAIQYDGRSRSIMS